MTVLEVDRLSKSFPIRSGLLQRETGRVRAVQDVSFSIARGEMRHVFRSAGALVNPALARMRSMV